jgi:hypothetical protein
VRGSTLDMTQKRRHVIISGADRVPGCPVNISRVLQWEIVVRGGRLVSVGFRDAIFGFGNPSVGFRD